MSYASAVAWEAKSCARVGWELEFTVVIHAPFSRNMWTRPVPEGAVNSESSMPILRRTHSMESRLPVTIAIFGMSPSDLFRGRRVRSFGSALVVHASTRGMVT
ncbi:MAG: hypothetical protein U0169_10095 [Polyangiaceae bacterium]